MQLRCFYVVCWFLLFHSISVFAECSVSQLPVHLARWIHREQTEMGNLVTYGKKMYITPEKVNSEYLAEKQKVFELKNYWIPEESLTLVTAPGYEKIFPFMKRTLMNGKREIRFFIHPDSATQQVYKKFVLNKVAGKPFCATPSSSGRTLLVWDNSRRIPPFFAKLSLNIELGDRNRIVDSSEVLYSVGGSSILSSLNLHQRLPQGFSFMPEVFGVIPHLEKGILEKEAGMIIRTIPDEIASGKEEVIPMLMLYSTPASGGEPYLIQMLRASYESPINFLRSRLIQPFARQWIQLALGLGISAEAHGQNTLIKLDENGMIKGEFVFRDLYGFVYDLNYSKIAVPEFNPKLTYLNSVRKDYFQYDNDLLEWTEHSAWWFRSNLASINIRLNEWIEKGLLKPEPKLPERELERIFLEELKIAWYDFRAQDSQFSLWMKSKKLNVDHLVLRDFVERVHEYRMKVRNHPRPRL